MIANATKPEAGMVLLLGLLFLTALTLLGLSASADAILQNQLAANLRESERAKQSALATQSWAEDWLLDLQGSAPLPCLTPCEGLYVHPAGELPRFPEFEDLGWWLTHGYEAGIDPLSGERLTSFATGSIDPPMWVIELAHQIPTSTQSWYRILVRASGETDNAISVIESTITRTWSNDDGSEPLIIGRVSWRELR